MSFNRGGVQIGHNSKLDYDDCAYDDKVSESVSPMKYRLNEEYISPPSACLSTFGPRGSFGVSSPDGFLRPAHAQDVTHIESILTNRNLLLSKCRNGEVNPVDVTQYKLINTRICDNFLDPVSTHLTDPPSNHNGVAINRFYNLQRNPQANIYFDQATNTRLEARDNFKSRVHAIKPDLSLPPTPNNC